MPYLQDIIHKLEEGGGMRYVRIALGVLAVALLVFGYNTRAFRNMATHEAMDAAQVGRNLSEGKGFSTLFIRPLSIYLVKKHTVEEMKKNPGAGSIQDLALLRGNHPDLANPPVYPLFLAGLMKVLPFQFDISKTGQFWRPGGQFLRSQPDFLISLSNQVLYLVVVFLMFRLALRLFDRGVAWVTAIVLLGMELFWRFSVSGLSTILLLLIFVGMIWLLVLIEKEGREPLHRPSWPLFLALALGVLTGAGALTRYSFGWVVVPVVIFVAIYGGRQRVASALLVLAVFGAVITPWIIRNYNVSGTLFGTAGMALRENMELFPQFRLQRSLEPDFSGYLRAATMFFWHKLLVDLRSILQLDLPKLGGTWVSAFFLVGLVVPLRTAAASRLRHFVLAALGVLIIAQALSRTYISDVNPDINGENLIVLIAPFAVLYGVGLFFVLIENLPLPMIELRYIVIAVFALVACLPMIFVFLPPRPFPIAYPPYDPSSIQTLAGWTKPNELIMTDLPWATAWYGNRQSVWLTRRVTPDPDDPQVHEDFFAIHDYLKPISALYLTTLTIDRKFISEWFMVGEYNWGQFVLQTLVEKRVPRVFPLGHIQDLPFAPDPALQPPEVRKRTAALDAQINSLGEAARKLMDDPKLKPALDESADTRDLLNRAVTLAEGRDFPLGSAPVRDMSGLEKMILRGQLLLTDRPRWK